MYIYIHPNNNNNKIRILICQITRIHLDSKHSGMDKYFIQHGREH